MKKLRFVPFNKAARDKKRAVRRAYEVCVEDGTTPKGFVLVPEKATYSIWLPDGSEVDVPALECLLKSKGFSVFVI